MDSSRIRPPATLRAPLRGLTALLALILALGGGCQRTRSLRPLPLPPLMLWAWERAEDLRFLQAAAERAPEPSLALGVAVLRAHVLLRASQVVVQRRSSTLRLPPGAVALPVIRIKADRAPRPFLDEAQRGELRRWLVAEAHAAGLGRLQIDYEAPASQRAFYRQLLTELRAELGAEFLLSVTALASWCLGDRWMAELPVDEIVPMFYRLGAEGPRLRAELRRGRDLAPECRRAHGLTTDEPITLPPTPRRLYLFSPASWHPAVLQRALAQLTPRDPQESP